MNNMGEQQQQQDQEQLTQPPAVEQTPAPEAAPEAAGQQPQAPPAEAPAQAGADESERRPPDAVRRAMRAARDRAAMRAAADEEGGVESTVVRVYRCAKVVKGGRTFSFGALVVAGDRRGNVGIGYAKANEVPPAVEKATKDARRNMFRVSLKGSTIPHPVRGSAGASTVVLVPARPGTGVTAGKSVRPVLELAGISDVLSKAYGSTSPKNLVKATIDALRKLQSRDQVERTRGVSLPANAGEIVSR